MPRVSVFESYSRTAADKAEWAFHYYEVDEIIAQKIDEWATPTVDEETQQLIIIEEYDLQPIE
jgi:hypothetical protein